MQNAGESFGLRLQAMDIALRLAERLACHIEGLAGSGVGGLRAQGFGAFWPVLRLWLRREVLPSIATRWSLSGQHSATQEEKQAWNRSGLMRFITVRSQSAQGMP